MEVPPNVDEGGMLCLCHFFDCILEVGVHSLYEGQHNLMQSSN